MAVRPFLVFVFFPTGGAGCCVLASFGEVSIFPQKTTFSGVADISPVCRCVVGLGFFRGSWLMFKHAFFSQPFGPQKGFGVPSIFPLLVKKAPCGLANLRRNCFQTFLWRGGKPL